MNDANYIEMDVHRATISVTALNAAVCSTLGAKRKKSRGGNKQYGVALLSASPGSGSDGKGRSRVMWQKSSFHGRAPKPVEL